MRYISNEHSTRRDQAGILRLLEDFDQSGLTQREFADSRGLAYSTFTSWLAKRRRGFFSEQSPHGAWLEVAARPPAPSEAPPLYEVRSPSGWRLRLGGSFEEGEVRRLLELIDRPCSP